LIEAAPIRDTWNRMSTNNQPPAAEFRGDAPLPRPKPLRRSLGPATLMALLVVGGLLAVVVALQMFVVRRIPPLTEADLVAAEDRWSQHGPASYDLDFDVEGAQPGTVHVEVRAGEVTAMHRDGVTPRQQRTWQYWSIPARFDEIERELELAADPEHEMQTTASTRLVLRCEFDPQYGFPRQFHRIVYGGGPEVYWRVTNFQPK
jgi:hypothetical protein